MRVPIKIFTVMILLYGLSFSICAEPLVLGTDFKSMDIKFAADYEVSADNICEEINKLKEYEKALELSEVAITNYKKAIDISISAKRIDDKLFYKYVKAIVLKYNYLISDEDEKEIKKKIYADALILVNDIFSDDSKNTIYVDFCMAMLWIENVEFYNVFEAATSGVADKIRKYSFAIYTKDKSFENYYSGAILGRIHFLTPNIPFLLTWPDKKTSKKYLLEAISNNPQALLPLFFLADTLYSLGEKEEAIKLYRQVMNTELRDDFYFEDIRIKRDCRVRMKQLGIK